MLQPCHLSTLCYAVCLWDTNNYERSRKLFNIAIHYGFFTLLAIVVPDLINKTDILELEIFWIHHYILLVMPLYEIWINRFPLSNNDSYWYWYWAAVAYGGFAHFAAQNPAALVSGINVNYMLFPPPRVPWPLNTKYYRVFFTATFFFLPWVWGYVVPRVVSLIKSLLILDLKNTYNKQSPTQDSTHNHKN